jgi:predicted TPR repeat methyltransferase
VSGSRTARVGADRFDGKYAASPDPWGYESSDYELHKYRATLAALPVGPLGEVLEIGCSIGVFTEMLAPRCRRLVAIDFSSRALTIAHERVGDLEGVELVRTSFPERIPPGRWDLILCSEVLYYLDRPALETALGWLAERLREGASVLAVSWRGTGAQEPMRGDDLHDLLAERLARWHALDARAAGYRLDRFDGDAGC